MLKLIRLTESDLHSIIRNTVKRVIREENEDLDKYRKKYLKIAYAIWNDDVDYSDVDPDIKTLQRRLKNSGIKLFSAKKISMMVRKASDFSEIKHKINDLFSDSGTSKKNDTPKEPSELTDTGKTKPNMDAVFKQYHADREKFTQKEHSPEEIQKASEILPPLIDNAMELYTDYASYDVNNWLEDVIYDLKRALFEYTGEDDSVDLPSPNPIDDLNHPDAKEAHDRLESFRKDGIFKASRELNSKALVAALKSASHASTDLTKILSGHVLNGRDKNIKSQLNKISGKQAADEWFKEHEKDRFNNNMQALQDM